MDARSDIFSFGATLYEMLTGRRAFERASPASTIAAILRDEPPPVRQSSAAVPEELDRISPAACEKTRSGDISTWTTYESPWKMWPRSAREHRPSLRRRGGGASGPGLRAVYLS